MGRNKTREGQAKKAMSRKKNNIVTLKSLLEIQHINCQSRKIKPLVHTQTFFNIPKKKRKKRNKNNEKEDNILI